MLSLSVALLLPLVLLILLVDDQTTRVLLSFFAWGAVAGFLAFEINTAIMDVFGFTLQALQTQYAPITEEFIKAIPLLVLFIVRPGLLRRREIILAAVFAGIGFSIVENYWYLVNAGDMGIVATTMFVATRSISTTIMHGLATGIVGVAFYSVMNGVFSRFGFQYVFLFIGYVLAVMMHAYFNLYVQFGALGETIAITSALFLYVLTGILLRYVPTLHTEEVSPT